MYIRAANLHLRIEGHGASQAWDSAYITIIEEHNKKEEKVNANASV